jgi:sedoheptulokinase
VASNRSLLGIDIGTTKVAVVLIDPLKRKILKTVSQDTCAAIPFHDPALKEQSVEKIERTLKRSIHEALEGLSCEVASVGITGQMHGIIGLDDEGRAKTNCVTWQDGRGLHRNGEGHSVLEEMQQKAGVRPIASGYGIVTLYWWVREKTARQFSRIVTIPDYFGMRMTGRTRPVIDYSMAESLGCFDIFTCRWDTDYISALGIPEELFPRVFPPTTVLGRVKKKNPFDIPCSENTPVALSIGDNQASYLGSVRDYYRTLVVNVGTASQVTYARAGAVQRDGVFAHIDRYDVTLRPFVEGGAIVAGSALSGGTSYRAVRDFFAAAGKNIFGVDPPEDLWERMNALALSADAGARLTVVPLFSGKRSEPEARGRIEGISMNNFVPSNLIYGTLEGVVRILRDMVDPNVLARIETVVGSGNGFRKNPALRKAASRIFEKDIRLPLHEEESAVGAALNGAVAAGVYRSFADAARIVRYCERQGGEER